MAEPWSWQKVFDFSPQVWSKALKFGLIWLFIILLGFTIWKAYFTPTQEQHQQNIINAQPGATVNVGQSQKQEAKKRPWWLPHIFTEIYAFAETDRTGVGTKGGLKWEF